MSKVRSTSFKKGDIANPNGRPKGSLNKSNILRSKFCDRAIEDANAAYEELRAAMQAGEGWAHGLYWKEIIPKRILKDTAIIDCSRDKLGELLKGLEQFKELTHDELLAEIKTLALIDIAPVIDQAVRDARSKDIEENSRVYKLINRLLSNEELTTKEKEQRLELLIESA